MKSNAKLLYCLLGSAVLTLLNHQVLSPARLGIFRSGYGASIFGEIFVFVTDIIAFAGYLLLILFSTLLIVTNLKFKNDKNCN
ncbi:hypothetical protein D3C80_1620950 [compost metagenome]